MKLKLYVKNTDIDECQIGMFGDVIASYNMDNDTIKVSLPKIWNKRAQKNQEAFIKHFTKDMSHEVIHREIRKEMNEKKISLGHLSITLQEWATKKLNNEIVNEFSLFPNIYQDMRNHYLQTHFQKDINNIEDRWKLLRNWFYLVVLIWSVFAVLITIRLFIT